jgi:hypothetical protein
MSGLHRALTAAILQCNAAIDAYPDLTRADVRHPGQTESTVVTVTQVHGELQWHVECRVRLLKSPRRTAARGRVAARGVMSACKDTLTATIASFCDPTQIGYLVDVLKEI